MAPTAPPRVESDPTIRARPGETPTAFAIRCIQAETWDKAVHHVEGSLFAEVKRAAMRDNPYRDLPDAQSVDAATSITQGDVQVDYQHTHQSARDGSPAMLISQTATTVTLVNEDGDEWTDPRDQWQVIPPGATSNEGATRG